MKIQYHPLAAQLLCLRRALSVHSKNSFDCRLVTIAMKTALCGLGLALPLLLLAQGIIAETVELNGAHARSYADRSASDATAMSFFSASSEPLPANLLMIVNGYYGDPSDRLACSVAETKRETSDKHVTVLLALSKCLNASSLNTIESWVADMKDQEYTFLQDGVDVPIEFATTVVAGSCQERNKHGLEDPDKLFESSTASSLFLSEDVLPGDLERVAAFAQFGQVLTALPTVSGQGEESEKPIAVIGFVNNAKSYDEVQQLERRFQVRKAFNFQICERGENSCEGKFENCVFLKESIDLFLYSPFTVTHSYSCEGVLDKGIPVSYVDSPASPDARQCFCTCPAGSELQADVDGKKFCVEANCDAEASCVWNTHPFGFKHEVTANSNHNNNKCSLGKIASDWGVPVPFPSDNYVADKRVNSHDDKDDSANDDKGPHIRVSATKLPSQAYDGARMLSLSSLGDVGLFERRQPPPSVVELLNLFAVGDVSHHLRMPTPIVALSGESTKESNDKAQAYTWAYYQSHRRDVIDALEFTGYGKYALTLDASDYAGNATCTGCLAIVDKFRPRATSKCPSGFTETEQVDTTSCAELSTANVQKAHKAVQQFFQFGNDAENDACSGSDANTRCDDLVYQRKDFFESSYVAIKETLARKVFKNDILSTELLKALLQQKNPLAKASDQTCASQEATPVATGLCKRCVKLSTALKEFWTDYTCNYEYDVQKCEGDISQQCGYKQCLVVNGDSLAMATAKVKSDVAKSSKALGATLATEIRQQLPAGCSSIGTSSACQFKSKLFKLIETTVSTSSKSLLGSDATNKVVFWRYRVKSSGDWKLWRGASEDADEVFSQATTTVFLEAWTPCGAIAESTTQFSVVLVLPKPSSSYENYAFEMFSAAASSLLNAGGGRATDDEATNENGGDAHDTLSLAGVSSLLVVLAAIVAVVALVVVVKRRRSATAAVDALRVDMEDDAYLPLLEY